MVIHKNNFYISQGNYEIINENNKRLNFQSQK